MSDYFRIYFGEDHVAIEKLDKAEVIACLNDEEDCFSGKMSNDLIKNKIPTPSWPENCECHKSIFIKGEIVIPKIVKVATKYGVD